MKGVKYVSWNDHSGYGTAARRCLRGLLAAQVPLTWTPMVPGRGWGKDFACHPILDTSGGDSLLDPICNRPIDYDTVLIHLVPEYFPRWVELENGKTMIGYTTWETDRLPRHWPGILNRLDRVWVPSTWNRDVFRNSGVTVPIDVIPHILASPPLQESNVAHPLMRDIPPQHFVFYSINVWSMRKALWLLCQAYWSAFSPRDSVTLVLKTSAYDSTHPWSSRRFPLNKAARTRRSFKKQMRNFHCPPPTVLIAQEDVRQSHIDALHLRGDCYVSLTHAEGWGLGAFDAVAAKKPVIITGYGGQTDFLPPGDAYLIDYSLVAVADPLNARSYSSNQKWADPDVNHAARLMRHVYDHREEAWQKGQRLHENSWRNFSEKAIVDQILSILRTL